jgi:hypothetical protein
VLFRHDGEKMRNFPPLAASARNVFPVKKWNGN